MMAKADLSKTSVASPPQIKCNACSMRMSAGEFYQKGDRSESICKKCRRAQWNDRYKRSMTGEQLNVDELEPSHASHEVHHNPDLSESISVLAETFLVLERWQEEFNTHWEVSNSAPVQNKATK